MRRGWPVALLLVATTAVGCGDGDSRESDGSVAETNREAFTVHEVLKVTVPPCETVNVAAGEIVLPAPPERPTECLVLGPARLDAEDIEVATLEPGADDGELVVALTLTPTGGAELDRIAARNLGGRMALVVYGRLVGAPTVHEIEFSGRVALTGLTRTEATKLVRELGGDAKEPEPDPGTADARRAAEVCEAFVPPVEGGAELNVSTADTAGGITQKAQRILGRTLAPWDALPPDHFVAGCAYSERSQAQSPTTVCPDGETYSLEVPRQYLVDEQGRSSEDPFVEVAPDHCH